MLEVEYGLIRDLVVSCSVYLQQTWVVQERETHFRTTFMHLPSHNTVIAGFPYFFRMKICLEAQCLQHMANRKRKTVVHLFVTPQPLTASCAPHLPSLLLCAAAPASCLFQPAPSLLLAAALVLSLASLTAVIAN